MATFSLPRFPENSIASFEGSRPPNPHSPNLEVNHGDETADLEPEERFFECVEFFEDSRPISPMTQNDSNLKEQPPSLNFTDLPPEIHLAIFSHLNACTSTCLGLTCNAFYSIHKAFHPTVNLLDMWYSNDSVDCGHLFNLLDNWMGPNLKYRWLCGRFVTRERFQKEMKKAQKEGLGHYGPGKKLSVDEIEALLEAEDFRKRHPELFR